ncbi:hypothetical protein FA15DRAFT_651534 [Coprinopsis marcescibilis]|uniref:ferric-chelate reductase (NADPH) n=1 Tax=Coprinopsis marcescibilis TaxID=230819 RepID=A0A5C3LB05_COPMA|nr:hypothetical protein FA15DRAFT_651534 [Coprinopsis marcescibilis]
MSEQTYKFDVKMTCGGCSGAVTRVLEKAKADGVSSFDVSLEKQEVIVKGSLPYDDVLARIKKTGKEVWISGPKSQLDLGSKLLSRFDLGPSSPMNIPSSRRLSNLHLASAECCNLTIPVEFNLEVVAIDILSAHQYLDYIAGSSTNEAASDTSRLQPQAYPETPIQAISTAPLTKKLTNWSWNSDHAYSMTTMSVQLPETSGQPELRGDYAGRYLEDHFLNSASLLYSYLVWAAFLSIFLSVAFSRRVNLPGRGVSDWKLGQAFARWAISRYPLRTSKSDTTLRRPSNGSLISVAILSVILACFAFAGPDYLPSALELRLSINKDPHLPSTRGRVIGKSLWTSAARTGSIAFASLPLCVLLGLKGSPFAVFSWRIGVQMFFDKLAFLHRWTARIIWTLTSIHVVLWCIKLGRDREDSSLEEISLLVLFQKERFLFGWLAFILFTLLMLISTPTIRAKNYRAFYAMHTLLFPTFLILCAFHHPETGWWALGGIGIWASERGWRGMQFIHFYGLVPKRNRIRCHFLHSKLDTPLESLYRLPGTSGTYGVPPPQGHAYFPPSGHGYVQLLQGGAMRLIYTSPSKTTWAPGQHFRISIPSLSSVISHPFTCYSSCHESKGQVLTFLVRARKGWTMRLWELVMHHSRPGTQDVLQNPRFLPPNSSGMIVRMYVEGPFGSSARVPWDRYRSVMVVVGGSGITFGLAIVGHLSRQFVDGDESLKVKRIRLIWVVREIGKVLQNAFRRYDPLLAKGAIQIEIFVSQLSTTQELVVPFLKDLDETRFEPQLSGVHLSSGDSSRNCQDMEARRACGLGQTTQDSSQKLEKMLTSSSSSRSYRSSRPMLPALLLDDQERDDLSFAAGFAQPGKPDIANILQQELEAAEESLLVACCGPSGLDVVTRSAVVCAMEDECHRAPKKHLAYYSEDFGV